MLFAAGLGTRLKPFTDKHPKALAPVNGKPVLQHNIEYLQRFGIKDVVVNVHHFADQIEDILKKNNDFGSNISISDERVEVLETGGGLKKAKPFLEGEDCFVVMNADILTTLDLGKLIAAHDLKKVATLAIAQRNSSRNLLFNKDMLLCGWENKDGNKKIVVEDNTCKPYAFSGIQVLSQEIFSMPFEGKFSIIDAYLHFAKQQLLQGYDHTGDLFIDIGKPESLAKAGELFK